MSSGCGSSPYSRIAAVLLGGATLVAAGTAKAECGRGAACLGHWQAPRPKPRLKRKQPRASPTEPTPSTTSSGWYGWQLLLVDVPVFAITAMRYRVDMAPAAAWTLSLTSGAVYVSVPAFLHWRRGRVGMGWISLSIRESFAVTGFIAGGVLSDCPSHADGTPNDSCFNRNVFIGEMIGAVLASTVDAAFLAWDEPVTAHPSALTWTPTLKLMPGGGSLGIAAAF